MSWKDVFKDLSAIEDIVQEMEENEDLDEKDSYEEEKEDQSPNHLRLDLGDELKSKLMNEILQFNQKAQLRNVNHPENDDFIVKESEEDTTPSDATLVPSDESKETSESKTGRKNPGLRLTNTDGPLHATESDNRRGSGILRQGAIFPISPIFSVNSVLNSNLSSSYPQLHN